MGEDHTASSKLSKASCEGEMGWWAVGAFPGSSVGNTALWSLKVSAHTLLGSAFVPPPPGEVGVPLKILPLLPEWLPLPRLEQEY